MYRTGPRFPRGSIMVPIIHVAMAHSSRMKQEVEHSAAREQFDRSNIRVGELPVGHPLTSYRQQRTHLPN